VAIVGAACRLPGAGNIDEFWNLLATARDAVTEPPPTRYPSGFFSQGGFLDQVDGFDPAFFEMSPHEAVRVDPHHRLLVETVWEAVEDAGLTANALAGSRTGVYTSCFGTHYWNLLQGAGMNDVHSVLGAHRWVAPAGRISHLLDLRGPSIETEATCASSLVAVHLACQAIRSGDISMAIVGAANLLLSDGDRSALQEAGLVSPSARCRFGDESADGYVPAEGVIAIILKPLADAVAAGDRIYATIMGSCVNSNGRQAASPSATGTTGQEDMLRQAFRAAGITAADVDYIEAHGPGTPSGDAVELTALRRVLGEGRPQGDRCLIGSVKSNIGHTEATSGLAGLLKTALAVHHRTVPATLHVERVNPVIRTEDAPVELVRTTRPWPDRGRPAIAGVTALGMFGISAHLVLTEAPGRQPGAVRPAGSGRGLLLPLSTKDPAALRELASAYADTLASAADPVDVCYSAGARRTQFPYRLAVVGADHRGLVDRLRRLAHGRPGRAAKPAGGRVSGRPRVAFVFSGQGPNWVGMARELLASEPVFARSMRECDELVRAERSWSLLERLHGEVPLTVEREIQPVLWAIQVSLAELWRHWGIEPDLVIGHSMGEVAAATTSGALSRRDAAAVICRRSALFGTLTDPGAMVAVELGESDAAEAIGALAGRVNIAAINGPYATVLAGDPDALATLVASLREEGVFCRPVRANCASHSPYMDPLREPLLAALADLRPRPGRVPMHSTVLDRIVRGDELDAGYWAANLRQPVRFASAVHGVLEEPGPTLFIEISPHPVLVPAIEDGIEACGADALAVPTLVRDAPERESMLTGLATAYTHGCDPDWARLYDGGRYVTLPSYPWQRKRLWAQPGERQPAREPAHPVAVLRAVIPDVAVLTEQIAARAAEVLAASPGSVDPALSLCVAGMDSVLAAKLRLLLKQDLDLHVPLTELLDNNRSLNELASQLHDRVSGRS
jgi:acyl transferase domain-containing protein